jgi:hypothetical protein
MTHRSIDINTIHPILCTREFDVFHSVERIRHFDGYGARILDLISVSRVRMLKDNQNAMIGLSGIKPPSESG